MGALERQVRNIQSERDILSKKVSSDGRRHQQEMKKKRREMAEMSAQMTVLQAENKARALEVSASFLAEISVM